MAKINAGQLLVEAIEQALTEGGAEPGKVQVRLITGLVFGPVGAVPQWASGPASGEVYVQTLAELADRWERDARNADEKADALLTQQGVAANKYRHHAVVLAACAAQLRQVLAGQP